MLDDPDFAFNVLRPAGVAIGVAIGYGLGWWLHSVLFDKNKPRD